MFWKKKVEPRKVEPRKPNKYLFGDKWFAEWREAESRIGGEGWELCRMKSDGSEIESYFYTDTDESAQQILNWLERQA